MEPLDDKTKQLLNERTQVAVTQRRALFQKQRAEADARKLAEARRFLISLPPALPRQSRNFVSIFVAPAATPNTDALYVEGVVFNVYDVMSGRMDGSSDFTGFDLITVREEISSWRQNYPPIQRGSAVRIKFIDGQNGGLAGDHMDDVVLEVWIDQATPSV